MKSSISTFVCILLLSIIATTSSSLFAQKPQPKNILEFTDEVEQGSRLEGNVRIDNETNRPRTLNGLLYTDKIGGEPKDIANRFFAERHTDLGLPKDYNAVLEYSTTQKSLSGFVVRFNRRCCMNHKTGKSLGRAEFG